MNDATRTKLEVFLLLALRRESVFSSTENIRDTAENDFSDEFFAAFKTHLPAPQLETLDRMRADYRKKSEAEKKKWQSRVASSVGSDELFLDPHIHRSHIDDALRGETAAVAEIVHAGMPPDSRNRANQKRDAADRGKSPRRDSLEKHVRRTFAAQFVARRNLSAPTAFDNLSGAHLARLIRVAGVQEVASACVRIDAVEAVASFLRRFSAEDARAIAAQLSALPPTSSERLLFAENLVQAALELELKPSAMLDLLGLWLIGIALCAAPPERVRYTEQKLPLEVEPKLSVTVETQRRKTPIAMQREINRQVERLAETIAGADRKVKT